VSTLLAPAPPRERVLPLRLAGHTTDVVIRFRPGRGGDLLVCIHGFGCAKESFDSGYAAAALADLSICAVDLPGHGASGGLPEVDDVIEAYAQVVAAVAEQLAPRRLFLLGHSMGGAVGLVATHAVPVDRFISVEGNLVAADCGLVTQQTATQSRDEFVTTGYARFLTELAASDRPDLRQWAGWYKQAEPAALHRLATSLLAWSRSGELLARLRQLPGASYVYGVNSDLRHLLPHLGPTPAYPVSGAGHFPMVDNPYEFWQVVAAALGR
jgi:pimeloyl-ACP methyl ester carboxylesterase